MHNRALKNLKPGKITWILAEGYGRGYDRWNSLQHNCL